MKYNQLNHPTKKTAKRVGRGISAGQGKTAGRGTKGQKARTGSSKKPGFSGGQNPLMQQLPKLPGFRSHRIKAENVFTDQLDGLKKKSVDAVSLHEAGLISSPYVRVKLLSRGAVKDAIEVKLPKASSSAIEALQKSNGSFVKVDVLKRSPAKKEQ